MTVDCLSLVFWPLRFPFIPSLIPQPLSILMEGTNFLPIKIWNGVCSTLCCRVDTVSDNMSMELAVSFLDEGHGAPVSYAPKGRTKYRANEVSCTHTAQGRATEKEKWINAHDRLRCVQLHRAKVRGTASQSCQNAWYGQRHFPLPLSPPYREIL